MFEQARRRRADHYRACGAPDGLRPDRSTRTLDLMMTGTAQFPQRALLLGVLWFPATFLVLWACAALGLWSAHHIETSLAVFFTALFIFAFTLQIKILLPAIALLRCHANMRLPLNYLLLAIGVLTAVTAAGFALVFGTIALNN